jgi:hypothetical protein
LQLVIIRVTSISPLPAAYLSERIENRYAFLCAHLIDNLDDNTMSRRVIGHETILSGQYLDGTSLPATLLQHVSQSRDTQRPDLAAASGRISRIGSEFRWSK